MNLFAHFKGDKALWTIILLLMVFSLLPLYSASSNLAYWSGGSLGGLRMLGKHLLFLAAGLGIIYFVHRIPYAQLGNGSVPIFIIVGGLLFYTLLFGVNISNAARWVQIPNTSFTFQPSALAYVVLPLYLARSVLRIKPEKRRSFGRSFWKLIVPVLATMALIAPSNLSTALLIGVLSMGVLIMGGYPIKFVLALLGIAVAAFGLYLLLIMAVPGTQNRLATWEARLSQHFGDGPEPYQVKKAKLAIAQGGLLGKGPGKSAHKNFLPQSQSDFIYAVIIEEYGILLGGLLLIGLYLMLLIRCAVIASNAPTPFGTLAAFAMGFVLAIQAFVNLAVAVNLIPVTGQTLPLLSAGGSSILTTCLALGVVLSVSRQIAGPETITEEADAEAPSDTAFGQMSPSQPENAPTP
jgi:cell division protein FtsW